MNGDKCPFRDTLEDWATRRRCISTRAESRIDRLEIMSAKKLLDTQHTLVGFGRM
jgi:hypothetical protein